MKSREDIESFVQQLLAAPTSEIVRALVTRNASELGPLFYEILEAHASADFAVEVAQIHMAARGDAEARILRTIPALLDWETEEELTALVSRHRTALDERLVDTLLDLAEKCIAYRDDPKLAERALKTADALIAHLQLAHLKPISDLHRGNLHLRRGEIDLAEAALERTL